MIPAAPLRPLLTGIPENPSGQHSGCRPRIGSDGLPDPAFGGGEVIIDPATLPGGVPGMVMQGMDPAPNGEILLTGGSPLGGGMAASPLLIRLHADGSLRWEDGSTDPPTLLTDEPQATAGQRAMVAVLDWLPIESQL